MKLLISFILFFFVKIIVCTAQSPYIPLDKNDPVYYKGNFITYQGKNIKLGPKAFYVDCLLDKQTIAQCPYAFNSFNKAMQHLTPGTEEEPMTVYIAPGVYWIDNPDDPKIRYPKTGDSCPFGIEIHCQYLKLQGLNKNPRHVVLAVARGQSQGAYGNFTMMKYIGDGLNINNMTLGNFCNIDLEYPLKPEWERKKRMSAITQAQLVFAHGDKHVCRQVHFLSRLNLGIFWGAKRTFFHQCYFEMTDDSMGDTGVYLDCKMKFFSSLPWGSTQKIGGMVLLNCDLQTLCKDEQLISKTNNGPATLIDVRYHSPYSPYLGWVPERNTNLHFYQSNVTLNGKQVQLEEKQSKLTNDITNKRVLEAYRIIYKKDTIYNTYNLLCGDDGWDPMNIKPKLTLIEKKLKRSLLNVPTHLILESDLDTITTGQAATIMTASLYRMSGYKADIQPLIWEYDQKLIKMEGDNNQKIISSISKLDSACTTVVNVKTNDGLVASYSLYVKPEEMPAPTFRTQPSLTINEKGLISLSYELALPKNRYDCSEVRWYRCSSSKGDKAILVKVNHHKKPLLTYQLTKNDSGYYIMAVIVPQHQTSLKGKVTRVIIQPKNITNPTYSYETDFSDFPTLQQYEIKNGFWTIDGYHPQDIKEYKWEADSIQNWVYSTHKGHTGLMNTTRGARLRFTPIEGEYNDMCIELKVSPLKTAGQGFGSATGQYMDICLKFDTRTLTGYGLRIIRTTKYSDAVDFYLVKYDNGNIRQISKEVSAICYQAPCYIRIESRGKQILADVCTDAVLKTDDLRAHKVHLEANMDSYSLLGGFAIQHTGSGWDSASCLQYLRIEWQK